MDQVVDRFTAQAGFGDLFIPNVAAFDDARAES